MRALAGRFWAWYKRNYAANVGIVAVLFVWQLVHLYWLTTAIVLLKFTGVSYFHPTVFWQNIIIFTDYIEIPTHLAAMLLYINFLRKGFSWKSVLMLVFINAHWFHVFWITDTFVVEQFSNLHVHAVAISGWLAWVAIAIDYFELPIIFDTMREFIKSFRVRPVV